MTLGNPMLKRKAQFGIKVEATEGTPEALAGADVLFEVEDLTSKFTREPNKRRPIRSSFSKKASVPGRGTTEISGRVELVGGGAAGTKPPTARLWGALGYAEYVTKKLTTTGAMTGVMKPGERIVDSSGGTVEAYFIKWEQANNRLYYMLVSGDDFVGSDTITGQLSAATLSAHATPVVTAVNYGYKPNSDAPSAYTAEHRYNGKKTQGFGLRGTGTFGVDQSAALAYLNFTLQGPGVTPADAALLTGTSISSLKPEAFVNAGVVTHDNVAIDIDSFNFDVGNQLAIRPSANSSSGLKSCRITDRESKLTIDPEEQLEADADFWNKYDAGTTFGFAAYVGSTEAKRVAILIPSGQYDGLDNTPDRDGIIVNQATIMTTEAEANRLDDDHIIAFF